MIHDATVEVTCDGDRCNESVFIGMEWMYRNPCDSSGFYDCDDLKIEDKLEDQDWTVHDRKHFCSPVCAKK